MNAPDFPSRLGLSGVPETMLWPLWNRAAEMRSRDPLIDDPKTDSLVARIDYDFAGRFGKPSVFHAVRARVCDDLIRAYLGRVAGDPVVVALGEGLETQFWRIGDETLRWFSIDLPEAIRVRRELLPGHPQNSLVECSALDPAWMDVVPSGPPPFVSAAGLLMYFQETEVRGLLSRIAERFPGAEIFFDTIPPFLSKKTLKGWAVTKRYTAPPMPWGISVDDLPAFLRSIPGLAPVSLPTYADPFPKRTRLYKLLSYVPAIRRRFAGALAHIRVVSAEDETAPGGRA